MLDLVLDTSTDALVCGLLVVPEESVGLAATQLPTVLSEVTIPTTREHMELLIPTVDAMMVEHNVSVSDIRALVVGVGPGPYTGLRVGLASAIALAQSWHKPLYSANVLAALAWAGYQRMLWASILPEKHGSILALLDARRKEWYWARFSLLGVKSNSPLVINIPALHPEGGQWASSPHEIDFLRHDQYIVCPQKIADQLLSLVPQTVVYVHDHPTCCDLWAVAYGDGSLSQVQPVYCRDPDAVPSREIKKVIPPV